MQVNDGATTVIGGIFVSQEQTTNDRTPDLHRIPLLGWLFRRDTLTDTSRELLIFITPRILKGKDMTKAVWGARIRLAGALLCALLVSSCGDQTLQGTASSYLIITSMTGPKGESTVLSDVITSVGGVPSTFNDSGQATFQLTLKDTGPTTSPNVPSQNNSITLTQ